MDDLTQSRRDSAPLRAISRLLVSSPPMHVQIGPRLPEWLRKPWRDPEADHAVKRLMRSRELHTVCESARCPNRNECFSRGTATFMIGGNTCTRHCAFCSV